MRTLRRLAGWRNAIALLLVAGGMTVIGIAGDTTRGGAGGTPGPGKAAPGHETPRAPRTQEAPRGWPPDAIKPPADGTSIVRMAAGS